MARKSVTGQLNMFDFWGSLDNATSGDVEMVSLMPSFEEEAEVLVVEEAPVVEEKPVQIEVPPKMEKSEDIRLNIGDDKAVMSRVYEEHGEKIEIAYLNYNKVRITRGCNEPVIKVFTSSKEAVDYYVLMMQEMEPDEEG